MTQMITRRQTVPTNMVEIRGANAAKDEPMIESYHYEPAVKVNKEDGIQRAAAYCRVSTLMEEQEYSFENQVTFYTAMIGNDPNLTLVGVYGDHGFSGLEMSKRKEFLRMLDDCEDGKIDVIYVKSISRFSRNAAEALAVLKRLKELGVRVLFEKEGLDSTDPNTEMILNIYATMAQNESCSHSENLRWAHRYRAQMGDPIRSAVYGYKAVKREGETARAWVIDEEAAPIIRRMFDMAYQGYLVEEIAKELGVNSNRVRGILTHEAYRGDLLTNKTVKPDYATKRSVKNTGQVDQYYLEQHHEPMVSPEVFDTVQNYLRAGYLNRGEARRRDWFRRHPEILKRRKAAQAN